MSAREAARLSNRAASLNSVVGYVTGGQDRIPLDRLCAAARNGCALMHAGADRVTVIAALVVAVEAAEVPRQVAEAVLRWSLRDAR